MAYYRDDWLQWSWVRFSVHSDYAAKQWALYVNGDRIAANLGFFDTGAKTWSEVFQGLGEIIEAGRWVLVFNELPWLGASTPGTLIYGK